MWFDVVLLHLEVKKQGWALRSFGFLTYKVDDFKKIKSVCQQQAKALNDKIPDDFEVT